MHNYAWQDKYLAVPSEAVVAIKRRDEQNAHYNTTNLLNRTALPKISGIKRGLL